MINKKVTFLNCFMGNARGGIEVVTRDYAEALKTAGYKSELLTLSRKNYTDYLLQSKLKTYLMSSRGLNPITILQFAYYLFKCKPDIVFLHSTKAIEFGTCKIIKMLFRQIKFIGVSHGVCSKKYKKLKNAIVVSPYLKDELETLGIPHVFHCPNMTDVVNVVKKKTPPPSHTLTIGTSGRLSRSKGFDVLLKALHILAKQKISFKCLFAGCQQKDFQNIIDEYHLEKYVQFLGWIDDKEKFYNSLDIYCSSSRIEPFGLTIIEAMMSGLPVVATKCMGPVYIIKPSFGCLVDIENPSQLADALKKLLKDKELREKMGRAARQEALKNYNKNNLSKHLLKICKDIIKDF